MLTVEESERYLEVVLLYQQRDVQQQTLLIQSTETRRHAPIMHLGQVHLHISPRHNTPEENGGTEESENKHGVRLVSVMPHQAEAGKRSERKSFSKHTETHTNTHSPLIGHGHVRGGCPSQSEDSAPCVQ